LQKYQNSPECEFDLFLIKVLPVPKKENPMLLSQFFNREKNEVLFKLYEILRQKMGVRGDETPQRESMGYTELCNLYNKLYKTS